MSDLLIKNMEKPTNCFTCILSEVSTDFGKLVCLRLGKDCNNTILEDCPLVELPPHSDLIDRDELLTDLADRICVDDMLDGIYQPAIDRINEAKTVLEAST